MSVSYLTASVLSSIVAYPFDLMKTRRQVNLPNANVYRGASAHVVGVAASSLRNSVFVSSKLYTYDALCKLSPPTSFQERVSYGMIGGLIGATVGTPFDRAMVIAQTTNGENWFHKVRAIHKKEGVIGFWKGYTPNAMRAIVVTGAQLGIYKQSMALLDQNTDWSHYTKVVGSSVWAGIVTAVVSNPIDVCKSRRMSSICPDSLFEIIRQEGVVALFRGVRYSVMRQIPVNLTRFMVLELF